MTRRRRRWRTGHYRRRHWMHWTHTGHPCPSSAMLLLSHPCALRPAPPLLTLPQDSFGARFQRLGPCLVSLRRGFFGRRWTTQELDPGWGNTTWGSCGPFLSPRNRRLSRTAACGGSTGILRATSGGRMHRLTSGSIQRMADGKSPCRHRAQGSESRPLRSSISALRSLTSPFDQCLAACDQIMSDIEKYQNIPSESVYVDPRECVCVCIQACEQKVCVCVCVCVFPQLMFVRLRCDTSHTIQWLL